MSITSLTIIFIPIYGKICHNNNISITNAVVHVVLSGNHFQSSFLSMLPSPEGHSIRQPFSKLFSWQHFLQYISNLKNSVCCDIFCTFSVIARWKQSGRLCETRTYILVKYIFDDLRNYVRSWSIARGDETSKRNATFTWSACGTSKETKILATTRCSCCDLST